VFGSEKKLSALQDELENTIRQLIDLKADLAAQKSAFRNLETEWINTHEKLKHIMGRLAKRDQREAEDPPELPDKTNSDQAPGPFDHLDPISRRVMERRSGR